MTRRLQIAVIGGGDAPPSAIVKAETLGLALVDAGYRVVCGGRGGVMEAACRGAKASANASDGDTVGILPGTDPTAANPYVDVVVASGLGLARNAVVVSAADAVVAVGGGAGTLSEVALAWQLDKPIVALDFGEGWSAKLANAAVDPRRDDVVHRAHTAHEAVTHLRRLLGS